MRCLALAVMLAGAMALGPAGAEDASMDGAPADGAERRPANPLWEIPPDRLTAMRQRPLFSPSRRPPELPVVQRPQPTRPLPVRPPEPEKPPLKLIGTAGSGTDHATGVFIDESTRTVVSLRSGEGHKGWVLRSVQQREVSLQKGRSRIVLTLPGAE